MEYVKLTFPEKIYAQKNLLQSELSFLKTLKHLKNYRTLRKSELRLKTSLKKSFSELSTLLKEFEETLPKEDKHEKQKRMKSSLKHKKRKDLESEIDEIKSKLARLSG